MRRRSPRQQRTRGQYDDGVGHGWVATTSPRCSLVMRACARRSRRYVVSVGQEPDTVALQQTLHLQLTSRPLPEAAKVDERTGFEVLKGGGAISVLLVLDDVWVAAHATPLNFITPLRAPPAVVDDTHALADHGARSTVRGAPPEASSSCCCARVDVSICSKAHRPCGRGGRAWLTAAALGVAGGIVAELADTWQRELVPLLRDELLEEASVEER